MVEENLEGSKCLELVKHDMFLCTNIDKVNQYSLDNQTPYKFIDKLDITLLEDKDAREPNEIIAIQTCQNEEYIAVISGKRLIGNEEKINQLFVFRYIKDSVPARFKQEYRIILKDKPEFKNTCMQFFFENVRGTKDRTNIIFVKKDQIFSLDFINDRINTVYKFRNDTGLKK